MEKVHSIGQMVVNSKVDSKTIGLMDMVHTYGQTIGSIKANGKIIR